MRVLVTGSRTWPDARIVYQELQRLWTPDGKLTVVHGKCFRGADRMAAEWCMGMNRRHGRGGVVEEPHPADWDGGRQAGFVRNELMVNLGADLCLAFIHNRSGGASHCAGLAEAAGITTIRFTRGKV
jgi:hypothetical protein